MKPLRKGWVVHGPGLIYAGVILVCKHNLGFGDFHLADIFVLDHVHKSTIIHLLHLSLCQQRCDKKIKQKQNQQYAVSYTHLTLPTNSLV